MTARLAVVVMGVLFAALGACNDAPPPAIPVGPAPDSFRVAFETTKGNFTVQVNRAWAPHGADRFYQLVVTQFFGNRRFFQVIPEFIAQFGLSDRKATNELWDDKAIPDDSVRQHNVRGTLTFAMEGVNTRSHQVFFNLDDNSRLDKDGFAPVGKVIAGQSVVDSLYGGYGERINQHLVSTLGNSMPPDVHDSFIKTARLVK